MEEEHGRRQQEKFQCCTDSSGQDILYLRALQGHSGRSSIDPSLQNNVLIPDNFFEYIYHIGCAINLHSIVSSGLYQEDRLVKEQGDLLLLLIKLQYKTTLVLLMKAIRSTLQMKYFVKEWKNPLLIMTRVMNP